MFHSFILFFCPATCSFSPLLLAPVGEPFQESVPGGPDAKEDQREDPGESDEQHGHLDRLAVPPRCSFPPRQGTSSSSQLSHLDKIYFI